jgi:hypothetical protein
MAARVHDRACRRSRRPRRRPDCRRPAWFRRRAALRCDDRLRWPWAGERRSRIPPCSPSCAASIRFVSPRFAPARSSSMPPACSTAAPPQPGAAPFLARLPLCHRMTLRLLWRIVLRGTGAKVLQINTVAVLPDYRGERGERTGSPALARPLDRHDGSSRCSASAAPDMLLEVSTFAEPSLILPTSRLCAGRRNK